MKKYSSILYFIFSLSIIGITCKKIDSRPPVVTSNILGSFTASVTNRTPNTALVSWSTPTNSNNTDTIKYRVILEGNTIANNLTANSIPLNNLVANTTYSGRVEAFTASGDTASAPFTVGIYTAPPPAYAFVTGFYKVTETSRVISTGVTTTLTFAAEATLINDSTIQFIQNRRKPKTWWSADFPTQIYPTQNDSLIGTGITPRGRILNQNTIRMSYLYGTTVVYDVKQLWEKLTNPADTALITYTYPNVPNMITTVAGSSLTGGGSGSSGDGGLATAANLLNPTEVIADNSGNIYINDGGFTYSIRKVSPSGIITRFAGNNTSGFSGDGGQATAAQLNFPQGLAIDASGNIYIADGGNRIIRKVTPSGIISTIAGTPGTYGYSGDGGPATAAQLGFPNGMVFDASGNLYFADPGKHVIRKISTSGIITTVAGIGGSTGFSGDGGQATSAKLNAPTDVCIDASGNLYIADRDNHAIRKVSTTGIITTIGGIGGFLNGGFTGDGGAATSAKLNKPNSVSIDPAGNIYISDYTNNRIRKISSAGIITTIAGNGQSSVLGIGPDFWGGDYGNATSASISAPYGNFFINNTLLVAASQRIRKITF